METSKDQKTTMASLGGSKGKEDAAMKKLAAAASILDNGVASGTVASLSNASADGDTCSTGTSAAGGGKRKAKMPAAKASSSKAKSEGGESALERKRRISRLSSKRLRDKIKNSMDELQEKRAELQKQNGDLKGENQSLRERIAMVKANGGVAASRQLTVGLGVGPGNSGSQSGRLGSVASSHSSAVAAPSPADLFSNAAGSRSLNQGPGAGAAGHGLASRSIPSIASNRPNLSAQPSDRIDDLRLQLLASQQRQFQLQTQTSQFPFLSSASLLQPSSSSWLMARAGIPNTAAAPGWANAFALQARGGGNMAAMPPTAGLSSWNVTGQSATRSGDLLADLLAARQSLAGQGAGIFSALSGQAESSMMDSSLSAAATSLTREQLRQLQGHAVGARSGSDLAATRGRDP